MNFLISVVIFFAAVLSAEAKTTFVYCSEASPKIFNPQLAVDGATFNASSRAIYSRLVEFEDGGTKIIPGLAESWQVSKDNKTFTFKLRKGVKFHTQPYFTPTRDFNADDVIFSFERMRDKQHPYHKVSGGTYIYFDGMEMGTIIKKVSKTDDYTVVFELSRPEAPFVADMAMDFASILSAEYAAKMLAAKTPERIDNEPVGTGPFILKKYVKESVIRYEKNASYYEGSPKIDELIFSITPDTNVRMQKLKVGECHLATEPAPSDIEKLKTMKDLKIIEGAGLNVSYLAINIEKKPFDNPLVRQALNMALNRKSYLDAIYLGRATLAKNPIPPTMWGYNNDIKGYEYNPKKAKELLKKAGFPNGFDTDLWTLPVGRAYNPNGKKMGEMMQSDLAQVGIRAKLITYKWAEYLKRGAAGEHSLMQMGWTGDNGDPDNFFNMLLGCASIASGSNYSRWCEKNFQSDVDQAKMNSNISARTKDYLKAQVIFNDSAPWVPLAHATVFKAMSKRVVGYKLSPFGSESFQNVDLK